MSKQSKSAVSGIAVLVTLWILIAWLWPTRAAEYPAGTGKETHVPDATPEALARETEILSLLPTEPPPTEIPTPTATPTPQLMLTARHLVQPGETLQSIADRHRTPVSLLAANLRVEELCPGNEIAILVPNPVVCPSMKIHVIAENDTLYNLAQRYRITLEALMAENGLTEPALTAGGLLCIPAQ